MFVALARAAAQPVDTLPGDAVDDIEDMRDALDDGDPDAPRVTPTSGARRRRTDTATNLTDIDLALCDCTNEELADALAAAPSLSAVIAAAFRAAGLADDPVPSWRTRSRWSSLVPAISSRIGNSESWREVTDPTVSRALSYDVRASWRLDRLVFDPNEPRFTAFDMARRRERRRIRAAVTHFYWSWLGARAALGPRGDDIDRVRPGAALQAQRALSELDALTDGWFSEAVATRAR